MGSSATARGKRQQSTPAWSPVDLRRPASLLAAAAALAFSALVSFNVSCQVHEVGHALVGTALGWTVAQVHLCLPTGGAVQYASTPGAPWVNTVESFAGGVVAAAFLTAVYLLVFRLPRTPLRGPVWWAAGFGPVLWIGPQLAVGVVEGTNPDRDYSAVLDANLALTLSAIAVTMLAGTIVHIWLWRSVWRRPLP